MTDNFSRARLDGMIDPAHALAVLAQRLPWTWTQVEQAVAPCFARQACPEQWQAEEDLFGATAQVAGGSVSNEIKSLAEWVENLLPVDVSPNPFDNDLLSITLGGGADYLVTGDKRNLLSLARHGDTVIVGVSASLNMIERQA